VNTESIAGVSITPSAHDREQDEEIRKIMITNEYNPKTYSHNCKPVGIRHYPGPNGVEKFYRTELRSIFGAVTYRYKSF
jgi:hypothetical protein